MARKEPSEMNTAFVDDTCARCAACVWWSQRSINRILCMPYSHQAAEFEHYLLEKSRLTAQGPDERNYHIFYFLLKGATEAERKRLGLERVEDYQMLMQGKCPLIVRADDPEGFDAWKMNAPKVCLYVLTGRQ